MQVFQFSSFFFTLLRMPIAIARFQRVLKDFLRKTIKLTSNVTTASPVTTASQFNLESTFCRFKIFRIKCKCMF